ncbi:MAG: glycosyltransferase [Candidatus Micrarchaeota archaeon]|nr:glycosyltransferase [Candidatus Micrarchaeota archaeon]
MKLLITQHNINERGGAEKVILKIAQKYDATIYTLGYNPKGTFEEFKDIDIRIFRKSKTVSSIFPKRVSNALHYGYSFYNLKVKEDYDVINAHMSPSEWVRNRNPRVLWYCHTPPRELYDDAVANIRRKSVQEKVLYSSFARVYSSIERRILNNVEAIATNSDNTKKRIRSALHKDSVVINPGIDFRRFTDRGNGRYFIYPSRFAEQKRQEYAIEAFSMFQRNRRFKDYKLVLAGSLSSRYADFSKYYERLRSMKARNVVFRTNPTDSELADLYSRSTGVLFTAVNEDYGIVPLEAMASRKPVISVNEGGPRETIVDGKTGFLVGSAREMSERMRYIAENGSIAAEMGRNGRKRVERNYSWNSFFKKFDSLARKVSKSG